MGDVDTKIVKKCNTFIYFCHAVVHWCNLKTFRSFLIILFLVSWRGCLRKDRKSTIFNFYQKCKYIKTWKDFKDIFMLFSTLDRDSGQTWDIHTYLALHAWPNILISLNGVTTSHKLCKQIDSSDDNDTMNILIAQMASLKNRLSKRQTS